MKCSKRLGGGVAHLGLRFFICEVLHLGAIEPVEEEIRPLAPPVLAPTSKAILVEHMHGNCLGSSTGGRSRLKWIDLQRNEKGQLPLSS